MYLATAYGSPKRHFPGGQGIFSVGFSRISTGAEKDCFLVESFSGSMECCLIEIDETYLKKIKYIYFLMCCTLKCQLWSFNYDQSPGKLKN